MGKHDYIKNHNNEYEELYVKYTLALRKLEAELKNLVDAYRFNYPNDDIVDHTKARIKSFESATKKLQKEIFLFHQKVWKRIYVIWLDLE